jgi:hypothetical protein
MGMEVIFNQKQGPLPIKVAFNAVSDGPTTLVVSGSVWTQTANQMIGIEVILDGVKIGSSLIFSNLASTHRATVPTYIPLKLAFGQHTLELTAAPTHTVSDYNDVFDAVLDY